MAKTKFFWVVGIICIIVFGIGLMFDSFKNQQKILSLIMILAIFLFGFIQNKLDHGVESSETVDKIKLLSPDGQVQGRAIIKEMEPSKTYPHKNILRIKKKDLLPFISK